MTFEDEEELTPQIRRKTRRTRIKDSRSDEEQKRYFDNGRARGGLSKPKGFKPRKKRVDKY